jgi:hypothetical protein
MASEAVASTATEGLTPAQKLMQEHADHHVTVEDVEDEDELAHPQSSAEPAADVPAPLSEKAAGKQKAEDAPAAPKKPALNTSSEEAFPALGPVKPRAQAVAPGVRSLLPSPPTAPTEVPPAAAALSVVVLLSRL